MAQKKKKKKIGTKVKRTSSTKKHINKKIVKKTTNKSKVKTKAKKKKVAQKVALKPVQKPVSKPAQKQSKKSVKQNFKKRIAKIFKEFKGPIIVISSFLVALILFYFASIVIVFALYNTVMPGTSVAGVDISSLHLDEVQTKLMERGEPFLDLPISVTMDGETKDFTPKELGISLLPRNTLQEIKFVNFKNSNIASILISMIHGKQIPFYVSVDIENAQKSLEEKFNFADKKTKDAYLTFKNKTLIVVPEQTGKAINTRSLYKDIKNRANNLSSEPINVILLNRQPIVTQAKLEKEMEKIEDLLYKKIYLTYENWDWHFTLADHIDWVKFKYVDNFHVGDVLSVNLGELQKDPGVLSDPLFLTKELKISIDPEVFMGYVKKEISPIIESKPQDVSIYKDENDKIIIEGKGENGRIIRSEYLVDAINLAVNNNINEVPIPVQKIKANVKVSDKLKMLGIETLIGTGRSAFAGSPPNRVHNIKIGVNKYNGLLIAPGETFSFNKFVGPVDTSSGYLPELVIKPEGTIPEYGGGLCQVSSTIYRAALMSGLPIVERAPHSYAVSYYAQIYGYGLDATIYIGVHDVKFINDTPGYILIQAYTEGTQAFFKFYGIDDGRTVELEGPYQGGYHGPGPATIIVNPSLPPGTRRQVEHGHTGFNVTWYRHLFKNGEKTTETIYSAYRAIPAKIMVGPSTDGAEDKQ
ncbi:VanW family protein [bacterium]|nr:VanW family protein [bacterium]